MTVFRPGGYELTKKAAESVSLHGKVLDIGCGLGASLEYLAGELGIEPHGVELSEETVRKAGKSYIVCADACALPFADESFDACMLECVLSITDDPEKAIDEAYRVLKKGGALIISTLTCGGDKLVDRGRLSLEILGELLTAKGFEIKLISDENSLLRSFAAKLIFEYGSFAAYAEAARAELGSCALDCSMPAKGTGYGLLTAIKLQEGKT